MSTLSLVKEMVVSFSMYSVFSRFPANPMLGTPGWRMRPRGFPEWLNTEPATTTVRIRRGSEYDAKKPVQVPHVLSKLCRMNGV